MGTDPGNDPKNPLPEKATRILAGIHPDLARVIRRAAEMGVLAFTVTEGVRTLARQKQLYAAGASTTMRSRHLTGHAVDLAVLVGGHVRWDWPLYHRLAGVVKAAAEELAVPIAWGGDWVHFKDGPHFELPRDLYPDTPPAG
jgi:peptidoglycan L-alanyl-D-glutamate endopeptidase CwlK